jgi:hypothetical protein
MIPGPRPPKGHDRPAPGRDRGHEVLRSVCPENSSDTGDRGIEPPCPDVLPVSLTRTSRGWSVQGPAGSEEAADLVEGMSLADLVAEEFGALVEPDRTARRSARGGTEDTASAVDPTDARMAALERTVAQLEHALAARVSTERAIGVLAERHGCSAREAFETLRRDARSQGRPVAELAREVLHGLVADDVADDAPAPSPDGPCQDAPGPRSVPAPGGRRPGSVVAAVSTPLPRPPTGHRRGRAVSAADGRS